MTGGIPVGRRRLRLAVIVALVGLVAFAAVSHWVGARLSAPMPAEMPPPPEGFRAVQFPSASGFRISGWYRPDGRCGTVILMHGVRANRDSLRARAELFAREGHSVLLFDFQGHGESPGEHITFGHLESRDAAAAVAFVEALRPVDGIARISHPVLVVAGSEDEHTTPADSRRLFAAAPEPKELWIVEGASHVDFHRHDPDRYREVVGGFLRGALGCDTPQ